MSNGKITEEDIKILQKEVLEIKIDPQYDDDTFDGDIPMEQIMVRTARMILESLNRMPKENNYSQDGIS